MQNEMYVFISIYNNNNNNNKETIFFFILKSRLSVFLFSRMTLDIFIFSFCLFFSVKLQRPDALTTE
jgi:hypothetical protein